MEATTQAQIKELRREIIELKLSSPYNPVIAKKIQILDQLIEDNK